MKPRRRRIRPYRPMTQDALVRLKEAKARKQAEIKNGICRLKVLSPERLRMKELQDEIEALGPLD